MIETNDQQDQRWNDLRALQEHYADFLDFYRVCSVELLGFEPTVIQYDIAKYIAYGPQYEMVQAQRGEAKSTITGCYAVWCLIHNPSTRVLIITAGKDLSEQMSNWCIQILHGLPELACLLPDTSNPGTRTSIKQYDVHHVLKGPEKSPSLACLGITSTKQGWRADIVIGDDIESQENSMTPLKREQLTTRTKELTAICSNGRVLYLGTPQSTDSIYNDLPARGFDMRIWTGRYPTEKEEESYHGRLAPIITQALERDPSLRSGGGALGDRGQVVDPLMLSESTLTKKEIDQGRSHFNLQYMLDTELSDADRYPLKIKDLLFYSFDLEDAPDKFIWSADPTYRIHETFGLSIKDAIYRPAKTSETFLPYTYKLLSIDPAGGGQNGDETGVAVLFANSTGWIAVMHVTGIPGGTEQRKLEQIVKIAQKWDVHNAIIERNFGGDAFPNAIQAVCQDENWPMHIETVWASGQKEIRIIDALEPVVGFHKLIINTGCLEEDAISTQRYPAEQRSLHQFLHQLKYISRNRNALVHDDRLEAVSQGVRELIRQIKSENKPHQATAPTNKFKDFVLANGKWQFSHRVNQQQQTPQTIKVNVMDRFKR